MRRVVSNRNYRYRNNKKNYRVYGAVKDYKFYNNGSEFIDPNSDYLDNLRESEDIVLNAIDAAMEQWCADTGNVNYETSGMSGNNKFTKGRDTVAFLNVLCKPKYTFTSGGQRDSSIRVGVTLTTGASSVSYSASEYSISISVPMNEDGSLPRDYSSEITEAAYQGLSDRYGDAQVAKTKPRRGSSKPAKSIISKTIKFAINYMNDYANTDDPNYFKAGNIVNEYLDNDPDEPMYTFELEVLHEGKAVGSVELNIVYDEYEGKWVSTLENADADNLVSAFVDDYFGAGYIND